MSALCKAGEVTKLARGKYAASSRADLIGGHRNHTERKERAAPHKLPAVYFDRIFAAAGGLISYGPDYIDQYRRAAAYVDRILRGEKPADLPVVQASAYEFVINFKAAKALDLTIPPSVISIADHVVE